MDDLDEELDDYFDFVLMEKDEFDVPTATTVDKNMKSLAKEMDVMKEKSELIAVNVKQSDEKSVKLEDFKIKKLIDKGSFGKVYHVVNTKDGQEYAMKRINKDILIEKGQIINTRTEKDILFQAKNPFILNMDYVFQNELRIYFFLEYVRGGNLFDHLCYKKRFSEQETKFIGA